MEPKYIQLIYCNFLLVIVLLFQIVFIIVVGDVDFANCINSVRYVSAKHLTRLFNETVQYVTHIHIIFT